MKRYVREAGSASVRRLLSRGVLAVSRLSEVEIASALSRRSREGSLTPPERDRLLEALRRDVEALVVVELGAPVVARAVTLLAGHPLRAGDAVQLASALVLAEATREQVAFVAFDRTLLGAAAACGLRVASGAPRRRAGRSGKAGIPA